MESFFIREATIEDAEAIGAITYYSWQDTYRGIVSDGYLDEMDIAENISDWHRVISAKKVAVDVVINQEVAVVGYICYGKQPREQLNAGAEIFALYLLNAFRRQGLGTLLFVHAVEQLKAVGVQSVCLSLFAQNPAVHFYRKFKPQKEFSEPARVGGLEYAGVAFVWSGLQNKV